MRRMYSKKQLQDLISEMSGDILEVKNVKQLNDEQCNGLKVGDVVAKKTGKQYHCYIVTFKQDKGGLCLSYFDASCIETQSYDYTAGHWVYNSEDKTAFADIGGLPDVTASDNNKVLEVIAGQWAKGGKKVNVIDTPSSTTLTDEQIAQIRGGVFINGEFLGYKNPILLPARLIEIDNVYSGGLIGIGALNTLTIQNYQITLSNKVISKDSDGSITIDFRNDKLNFVARQGISYKGKTFPVNYPLDSNVGHFIFRKGTLEWYIPVAQDGITSGDVVALDSALGKALLDHLDVEINEHRCRYERTNGNYVVYSWKDEADSGVNLEINMISYNTTNGELSFNVMKFAPIV